MRIINALVALHLSFLRLTWRYKAQTAAASLLDGMTIVPSPSVMSLASTTIPTPTLWSDARALPFTTRSGGARGDSVSVLTAVTAPPTLQGCAVFGGGIGGGGASLPSAGHHHYN